MSVIIKLRGVKDKAPYFSLYNTETKAEAKLGTFLNIKINGLSFKEEEYEGVLSYKLKMNVDVKTSNGIKENIFLDLGGSSAAKSILNSLLSATTLDNIQISVYKSTNKNTGIESVSGGVLDLNIQDNGVKGIQNSRVLQWYITPEEKSSMVEEIKNSKGEIKSRDFSKFDESLRDILKEKFGASHPLSFTKQISGDIFDSFDIDNSRQTKQSGQSTSISDGVFDDNNDMPF